MERGVGGEGNERRPGFWKNGGERRMRSRAAAEATDIGNEGRGRGG